MFGSIALWFDADSSDGEHEEDSRVWRRNLRDSANILEIPDGQFLTKFRVNKEVFLRLLDEIEPHTQEVYRSTHIPAVIKLATFLTFIGSGGYQKTIGKKRVSSMSKTQVSRVIGVYLEIFEKHLCPKWITLEKYAEDENSIKKGFYKIANMPDVVGCVDGTDVRILTPRDNVKELHYNRKEGYCSLNVVAICDHNMTIRYVDSTNPGSIPDDVIWQNCTAKQYFETNFKNEENKTWLLGNCDFKLQPYIMTPYRQPNNDRQHKFNKCHRKTYNIIERCLSVLKQRFKCLKSKKGLHYSPQKASTIVNSCCAVHNICLLYNNYWLPSNMANDDVVEEQQDEEETSELLLEEELTAAHTARDEIANNLP